MIYLAIGFPPAAKSCAYRMRETANQFVNAGWDVTVVTIAQDSWERDSGVDLTLLDQVDPLVKIVELPLAREDLETDIRLYSEARALKPNAWVADLRVRQTSTFPEPN
ncbi:glycosyl transferase, partial [[Kitasatospora] papulosa]